MYLLIHISIQDSADKIDDTVIMQVQLCDAAVY